MIEPPFSDADDTIPFPKPGHDGNPIKAGEWGCMTLVAVSLLFVAALAILT